MQIQNRLNIGFDTIVFVDDQEFERDGARFSHPDVETVDAYDYLDLATAPRLSPEVITEWTIELLLMPCRTLSKGAGTVLLTLLMQRAAERYARFRRTSLNRQMLLTYQLPNFEEVVSRDGDDYLYGNDLTVVAEYPEYIQIDINRGDGDKEAVQVLGANGCWEGYPVERLYREAKILQIIEGTNEMQQMLLADHALKTFSAGPTPTPTDFTRSRGFSGTPR
ncbi:acyl-CoA dehydrogenase family protein [Schaalia odontolytica]